MSENEKIRLPVSAVMVIYNEEKVLERALKSFHDIVDEIIIVHDGKCSDKSLEIAKRYTDKIFELEHVGISERHRPFAYNVAKNDWILHLDADEYLSPELKSEIGNLISDDVGIYEVSWSTFQSQKHHFWFYKRALFKKSKVYFVGVAHEAAEPLNKKVKIKKTECALMHEPLYDNLSYSVFQKKWKNLSKIQARQLLEDFSVVPKWNCPLDNWERHRRIRKKHPILFGMIATPVFHTFHCAKNFLKDRNVHILKMGIFAFLYHIHLYYYLNKYKKDEKI
jgi:glycosyltransferase involved in cell wall biosynthesis